MEEFLKRLDTFLASERLTIKSFEKVCGLYNGYICKLKTLPKGDKVGLIQDAFPNLNVNWLLHGDGSMYNNVTLENCTNTAANNSNVTIGIDANVMKIIEEKDTQISRLLTIIENLSK